MAWKNGYYYRNRRQNGRVFSDYIGAGPVAELLAQQDEQERLQRKVRREQFRRLVAADSALQRAVDDLGRVCADVVKAALLVAGYHQHKRQWRKEQGVETIEVAPPADIKLTASELNKLITAVDSGKPTKEQRQKLAECFERLPTLAQLQGDIMIHVTGALSGSIHGAAGQMAASYHLGNLKQQLGYDDAPIMEKMLIEHILVCWLRLSVVEWRHHQHTKGEHRMSDGAYWDKALTAAQKRYLRVTETLAKVRRLNISVQVNIGQNQQIVSK